MRLDLVEHQKVLLDLLGNRRGVVDLALVEVLVLERAVEALYHAVARSALADGFVAARRPLRGVITVGRRGDLL